MVESGGCKPTFARAARPPEVKRIRPSLIRALSRLGHIQLAPSGTLHSHERILSELLCLSGNPSDGIGRYDYVRERTHGSTMMGTTTAHF